MPKLIRFIASANYIYSIFTITIFQRKHYSFIIFLHREVVPLDSFNT